MEFIVNRLEEEYKVYSTVAVHLTFKYSPSVGIKINDDKILVIKIIFYRLWTVM